MSVIWRKVWFDLWGNKIRTSLAVLSIAAGVFAIGAVFGLVDQLLAGMDRAHQSITPSHIWMTLNERIDQGTADRLKHIKGVEEIEVTNEVAVRYKLKPEGDWRAARLLMWAEPNPIGPGRGRNHVHGGDEPVCFADVQPGDRPEPASF